MSVSCLIAQEVPANEKYTFEATYPEGFGRIFQKVMTIRKIPKDPRAKAGVDRYYLVYPDEEKAPVSIEGWRKDVDDRIGKALALEETVTVRASGYESIESSGSPSLSASAPENATEWIPADYGWHVRKVIYLMALEIVAPAPEAKKVGME